MPLFCVQCSGEHVKVLVVSPRFAVADDIEPPSGATDGDVEKVGLGGGPRPGSVFGGVTAEDQEDNVGFFPLGSMDRAEPDVLAVATFEFSELSLGISERCDDEHFARVDTCFEQLVQPVDQSEILVRDEVTVCGTTDDVNPPGCGRLRKSGVGRITATGRFTVDHEPPVSDLVDDVEHRLIATSVHHQGGADPDGVRLVAGPGT